LIASTFPLGDRQIRRTGYGAMQLAGPNVFGAPDDPVAAIALLRAAVAAGVNHIDTAQYYGPDVVNDLIREALHPYPDGLSIVSKVAARRDQVGRVLPYDDPDQLRAGIEENLRSLKVDQLAAVNLRLLGGGRVDARFDDQLAAMVKARNDGLIAGVGLSNVTLDQFRHALLGTDIVCVQNLFHLADRSDTPILEECLRRGIAYVPFCPLGLPRGGENPVLTHPVVNFAASRLGVSPARVALCWLLQAAPNILLIPGTASLAHLRDNLAADDTALDDQAIRDLDTVGAAWSRSPTQTSS
jgi:pyridoxine 4-dehydrogenase